jgi:hypothetical protein
VSFIGIILLMGIVKKNAIMMIDFALYAERHEGLSPRDAIYQACIIRFRPIMMTTMAALFGALPRTSLILELEVTPEYLGQNKHLVGLPAQWATYLAFDLGSASGFEAASGGGSATDGVDKSLGEGSGGCGVHNRACAAPYQLANAWPARPFAGPTAATATVTVTGCIADCHWQLERTSGLI